MLFTDASGHMLHLSEGHAVVYFVDFDCTHIDDPPCPICPTLEELCHSLTSNSSWLCQHSPINSPPPPTFHTGIGGHRRYEIDEGALVKMSVGDHGPERGGERERASAHFRM